MLLLFVIIRHLQFFLLFALQLVIQTAGVVRALVPANVTRTSAMRATPTPVKLRTALVTDSHDHNFCYFSFLTVAHFVRFAPRYFH